ncbi:MAG: phosphoenolpyruvate-utilizing N-terminal domain-containing protein, partial [candidate division WOR-3 bacterium]
MEKKIGKRFLKGIAASPGIAIGQVCVLQDLFLLVERRRTGDRPSDEEVARFMVAVRGVTSALREDYGRLSRGTHQVGADIFLAHLAILEDPYFIGEIIKDIREHGATAETAVLEQVDEFRRRFEGIDDPYLRERGSDVFLCVIPFFHSYGQTVAMNTA